MDQRAAVRVPVRVRAQCRTGDVVIDGVVEDVSRSGLFVSAALMLDAGDAIDVDLALPGEGPVHLCAEVVRVEHAPRTGMGLRFVGDVDPSRRPLANFIMRQHATSL